MRTIKFRGQDIETGEWLKGDLLQTAGHYPQIRGSYCDYQGKVQYQRTAVKPETVGQFTGLSDKDGNEIYEGDILAHNGRVIGYVVGGVRGYCYDVNYINHKLGEKRWTLYATVMVDFPNALSVVGNRWDDPELMKGDAEQRVEALVKKHNNNEL